MSLRIPVLPSWVRWGLVALVAGGLLVLSLGPTPAVLEGPAGFAYGDELQHVVAYAILALTITYAWLSAAQRPMVRGVLVFAIVATYGLAIEGLQSLVPSRSPDLGDGIADILGASFAFVWDGLVARWVQLPAEENT